MKQNIMKKWVKALRSGKYKQGQGVLKQTNGENRTFHCCLGVLCELYNEQMRKHKKKILDETRYNGIHRFNKNPETLPKKVQEWSGLKSNAGNFKIDEIIMKDHNTICYTSLADMNDLGRSFKQIAKTIEKEWENL